MNIKIENKVSDKGKQYTVLLIELVPGYEKSVFLDKAEVMLLQQNKNTNKSNNKRKFCIN